MAKNINPRCPFSAECEKKKCVFTGVELNCGYYRDNACPGSEIEDLEELRRREDEAKLAEWEEAALEELAEERSIELITAEIRFYKAQAGGAIIEIGRRLLEAKEKLTHGQWLPWLEEHVEISEGHAQRFMRLAKEYPNPSPVTDLGVSKALALLALPPFEREEFASEKHLVDGEEKTAFEMSRRELAEAIRERNEARERAERAEKDLAEQLEEQQAVYDTDMDDLRGKLAEAEEMAATYRERAEHQRVRLQSEVVAAREALETAERELDELRSRPVEVAVETVVDEEALKKAAQEAKAEAEAALAEKLQAAEKAREAAEQAKEKAEQALRDAEAEARAGEESHEVEVSRLKQEAEKLSKQLRQAGSQEVAIFKVHFTACQQEVEAMCLCIDKLREGGDAENADKLRRALQAVLTCALEDVGA